MAVVTLLTDFGTRDGYVAAMKGVILSLHPSATIVDVTHEVAAQDVREAAYVLLSSSRYYPAGTVHVTVVDPGVGTERAAVILDVGDAIFVAPDNGVLTYVLAEPGSPQAEGQHEGGRMQVPEPYRAFRLEDDRYWLPEPSNTFHGRDIFAPVAAYLSRGEPPERFGPAVDWLECFPVAAAKRSQDGVLHGEVIHIDRFGNLITNLPGRLLPRDPIVVEMGGHRVEGLVRTYADGWGLVALVGSAGYLEVALPGGSAREVTGLAVGSTVRVSRISKP